MTPGGVDGSINIDTKINSKNFNEGMKKLSGAIGRSMGALTSKLASVAVGVSFVASAIIALGAGIIALGIIAGRALIKFINNLYESLSTTSAYRSKVEELRNAFDNLKGSLYALGATLLNAIAPALMAIIDWLVKAINFLNLFIGALTGQKSVMQYVSGATQAAAGGAGKLAKNTKDAEKAAKGALAAFDQINVLQQETPDTESASGGGGGAGGGSLEMIEVPIPEDFIKNTWENILNWMKLKAAEAWFWIWDKWMLVINWVQENIIVPLLRLFVAVYNDISRLATIAWNLIQAVWGWASEWFKTQVIIPLLRIFVGVWSDINRLATIAWNLIKAVWGWASNWFKTTVTDPIINAFKVVFKFLEEHFPRTFNFIKNVIKAVVNSIIFLINAMLRASIAGINATIWALNKLSFKVPSWVPGIGGSQFGFNLSSVSAPQIPYLAKGGVIPPNSEFLAVLGDNKSQNEILAPENLIRQIFQEEMGSMRNQEITINFAGNMGSLVREMKPYIDKEYQRIGKSLIKGSLA